MASKQKKIVAVETEEIAESVVSDDSVEIAETVEWVEPTGAIRSRLETLIYRRSSAGTFRGMVEQFLNGRPVPVTDDEWQSFIDTLER